MVKLGGILKNDTGGQSLYIHCLVHCCDLIIKDLISTCSLFTEPMQTCYDLYALIGISPKRILIFEKFQEEYSEGGHVTAQMLQGLSVTLWTARGKAAKVILDSREALAKVLIDLQKGTSVNPLARSKAKKLEKDLRSFNKVFGLVLLYEILTFFEDLSRHLQSIDLTPELACFCINKVRERVK